MTLLDGDSLADIFAFPTEALLALPSLTLDDLDQGPDFIDSVLQVRPPQRRPVIHIPGFDDIIHVVPESFLPPDERARLRRERAIRIQESPTPESVRAIGSILTWIDDINDALITASVATRLASIPFPALTPVAVGLGVAAEALNIFQIASLLGRPTLLTKFRAHGARAFLRQGVVARAKTARTLARALPTVGEAVQILQTTDQLFGVGLSLGPIVGLFTDLVFGLPQGAEFAFQSGIRYRPRDELFLREEDQQRAEDLQLNRVLGSIVGKSAQAAWVLSLPDGVSFSDRVDSLVHLSLVAELGRGFIPQSRWEPLILSAVDRPIPSTRQIKPDIAVLLRQLGEDPEATESFPVADNPKTLSPTAQGEMIRQRAPQVLDQWLADAPSIDARLFAERHVADLGFRMVRAFEGPGVGFASHGSPIWRAVVDSLEIGLVPPKGSPDPQVMQYLERAAQFYEDDPTRKIPQIQLQDLFSSIFSQPQAG